MENKDINSNVESRRSFLKKAAYSVPTIIALGQITTPIKSSAGSYVGGGTENNENGAPGNDRGDAYNIFGK